MENFMNLKIKALSINEAFARSTVAAFCVTLNPTIDQLNDVKTAVSEAVTNSVVHGYGGSGQGTIDIEAYLENRTVHITVKDTGVGIADIAKAREPFYTTKAEQERAGMGFTVMESFMDTLNIENNIDGGLIVKMSKDFDAKIENGD